MCPSEMPSSNLTPSTGTLTVHHGPGTPSMLYLCHRFSSLVGFRAPCAGSSPRATEQGDSCPVLWQSWGEAACCCPARLPPPRLARLLGKQQLPAAPGASASALAGQREEGEMSDQFIPRTARPFPRRGRESGCLCLKIRQSLGLCVTHSMLFSARLSH